MLFSNLIILNDFLDEDGTVDEREFPVKANPSVVAEGRAGILFHQFGKCVSCLCFLIGLMDHRFHGYEFCLVFKGFKFLLVRIEYGFFYQVLDS